MPTETFRTNHILVPHPGVSSTMAFKRQQSPTTWYPYDTHYFEMIVEAFDNNTGSALPIYAVHQFGGVAEYYIQERVLGLVTTARTDLALLVQFDVRVTPFHKSFPISHTQYSHLSANNSSNGIREPFIHHKLCSCDWHDVHCNLCHLG